MEILLDRENDLILKWHPGCSFRNGSYSYGPIGNQGCRGPIDPIGPKVPISTDLTIIKEYPKISDIPKCLRFSIYIKNSDQSLYENIKKFLYDLKNFGDQIDIEAGNPKLVKEKKRSKRSIYQYFQYNNKTK